MGKAKKTPKFAVMKKMVTHKAIKQPQVSSALFFKYNTALGPPYRVLVDTNFINFSIQNKVSVAIPSYLSPLDLEKGMMDCLYAKCTPCITDCVMAELEKLGQKYRVALRLVLLIAKDPRFERLPCTHKGTYADDCLVDRVTEHKCYIVATCDRDLKRRIRKIPGVPIMYIAQHRYSIERLPEATIGGGRIKHLFDKLFSVDPLKFPSYFCYAMRLVQLQESNTRALEVQSLSLVMAEHLRSLTSHA
ncbi:hypothetical protein DH2020_002100 [Rehmannia glutinosa]|uniref:PIN domain-containing protein n=1 Tax=Rehmannia glutinosa TaxID=99300 RepID=A0ABR0XSU4_REHGL